MVSAAAALNWDSCYAWDSRVKLIVILDHDPQLEYSPIISRVLLTPCNDANKQCLN